ncbi:MAG: TonB-dependent receptor [Gemmatimonadota bacterium]
MRQLTLCFHVTLLGAIAVITPQPAASQALDSLLDAPINAASKYEQKAAEAPASVTIVTADEIRRHDYRTIADVLESVRGFYISNDRNYTYMGVRGFGRPTDYNNRILLLIDGQTVNDRTWAGAPIGGELPFNVDAIERVEIVRGPGSALYGTGAMFGVINVVTKTGTQLDGTIIRGRAGSDGLGEVALTTGRALGANGSAALSVLAGRSDGGDLYFPEYDTPAQNGGVARGLDWERGGSALASLSWKDISTSAGYRSRSKGIPTGAYSMVFGDARAQTWDQTIWGSVAARREVRAGLLLSGLVYGDRYDYEGTYPLSAGAPYGDGGGSADAGAEALLLWDATSRHRLSFGSEFRHVSRADYWERQLDGTRTSDDQPFDVTSFFAQIESQLLSRLALVAGVRREATRTLPATTVPRFALIANPDERTSVKLLFGEAFRSPSPAEATITTTFYIRNPGLRPERIRSTELEIQRRVASPLLVGLTAYRYQMRDLIEQVAIDTIGTLNFSNTAAVDARGTELQIDIVPLGALSARATYALQAVDDRSTGQRLSNSPEQIAHVTVLGQATNGLRAAVGIRYESGRRTLGGGMTRAFTRSDLSLGYASASSGPIRWIRGGEVLLRVTNLFDATYAVPGGLEHLQNSIPQRGRQFSLSFSHRSSWRR